MSLSDSIASIMHSLEEWALLPKYQLERRVDIFLTPFLEALVGKELGGRATLVVPEFPLLADQGPRSPKTTAHTVNVDYLFWVEPDGKAPCWVLLELKTDAESFKEDQALLYGAACVKGMRMLRVDLGFVRHRSKQQAHKYRVLVRRLAMFDRRVKKVDLYYLGPSDLEERAKKWKPTTGKPPDGYLKLSDFAKLPPDRIPPEHAELWPFVRDLLLKLDTPTAQRTARVESD